MPASPAPTLEKPTTHQKDFSARFRDTRAYSLKIVQPLETEDLVVQTDFVVSPLKWHLGHTAWLFEHFILKKHRPGYQEFHPNFHLVFNSYYTSQGMLLGKNNRGMLSRPTVRQVLDYRAYVDEHMERLLENMGDDSALAGLVELGIQHEKQHQELMLYDLKHILWTNPLKPIYLPANLPQGATIEQEWLEFEGGLHSLGWQGDGFSYDNEQPVHQVYMQNFAMADRCVTNSEYRAFIEAGGYDDPRFWLWNGWARKTQEGWQAPLYWHKHDGAWFEYTLHGIVPLQDHLPVCHLSHYEADAYARWAGHRLPTESELELLVRAYPYRDLGQEERLYHPTSSKQNGNKAVIGQVWEWSQSAYLPYPGYRFLNDGLGEYNGKFMSDQMVLRGASCLTPPQHTRYSYRNFFDSSSRWQCSGIRLARI